MKFNELHKHFGIKLRETKTPAAIPNMNLDSTTFKQQAHFSFGDHKVDFQSHNMSCRLNNNVPNNIGSKDDREELKERMRKASFTFGPKSQSTIKSQSIYESGIDASAKLGGQPSDGEKVKIEMRKTSFKIGEGN